jgi:hypothetical protein
MAKPTFMPADKYSATIIPSYSWSVAKRDLRCNALLSG